MQPYPRWHVDVNVSDCLDYVDGDIDGDEDDGDEPIPRRADGWHSITNNIRRCDKGMEKDGWYIKVTRASRREQNKDEQDTDKQ